MLANGDVKFCPSCQRTLPLSAFAKSKQRGDGLTVYCKECKNRRQREKYNGDAALRSRKSEYAAIWRIEHREEQLLRQRKCYLEMMADPEKREHNREMARIRDRSEERKKSRRKWLETERGRKSYNATQRRYRRRRAARDPEFRQSLRFWNRQNDRRRRAGEFPFELWEEMIEVSLGECQKCGNTEYLECDHVVPLIAGGQNTISNLQLLCRTCNRSKGTNIKDYRSMIVQEWIELVYNSAP